MDGMYGNNGFDGMNGWNGYPYPPVPDTRQVIKDARKRFSLLGGIFLGGTIIIYAIQIMVSLAVQMLKPEWLWDGNMSLLLSVLPMYLVGMPVLILLVKIIPADRVERRRMKAGQFAVAAIMCYAIVYASNLVGIMFTSVIGVLKGSAVQNQIQDITESVSIWMILIYMVICAPIMEEYIFRKLIVDRTVRYGQGIAVVTSGLMFGLFHGNLNQFVYAFTLGMFLAFLYVKTGNLKITIALHMMINFMGGLVSTGLLKLIDIDEYMDVMLEMDRQQIMSYVLHHLLGWILYIAYACFILGVTIAGVILFIVCLVKKKFVFGRDSAVLPRGKKFSTVILNVGMILYSIFWIAMIVWQLFV